MDVIFASMIGAVVLGGAAATVAALYAISLRAKVSGLAADVAVLELDRAERDAAKQDPYRSLELEWERLKARWHRHGEPFSLALIDLGDALRPQADLPATVMAKALAAIDEARRTEDCAFQLDERTAAVLLAGSSTVGGWAFVERLRRVLGNEPFAHEQGASYVDVRVGIAEWSIKSAGLTELIEAAYRARKDFSGQIFEQRGDFLPGARGAATG